MIAGKADRQERRTRRGPRGREPSASARPGPDGASAATPSARRTATRRVVRVMKDRRAGATRPTAVGIVRMLGRRRRRAVVALAPRAAGTPRRRRPADTMRGPNQEMTDDRRAPPTRPAPAPSSSAARPRRRRARPRRPPARRGGGTADGRSRARAEAATTMEADPRGAAAAGRGAARRPDRAAVRPAALRAIATNQAPVLAGYELANVVEVTVRDLGRARCGRRWGARRPARRAWTS